MAKLEINPTIDSQKENAAHIQSGSLTESSSLTKSSLDDMRALFAGQGLKSGTVPDVHFGKHGDGLEYISTRAEKSLDDKVKDCFSAEVLSHLKDQKWLRDHEDQLQEGFKKAGELGGHDLWDIAWKMSEESKVGGKPLIFLTKLPSDSSGNLVDKRWDINLDRGSWHFLDPGSWHFNHQISQVYQTASDHVPRSMR